VDVQLGLRHRAQQLVQALCGDGVDFEHGQSSLKKVDRI